MSTECPSPPASIAANKPKTDSYLQKRLTDPAILPGPEENVGTVVAFAKWSHPVLPDEDYVEPPWIWPEGTDLDTLRAWTAKAAEAERLSVGDTPCYRMSPCRSGTFHSLLLVHYFHGEPEC